MKNIISGCLAAILSITLLCSASIAADLKAGDLAISHAWARATPKLARTGAAYLVISNAGATDDTLIGVKSEVAGKTGLHQSAMSAGVMKMSAVARLAVPAGAAAVLEPGGYHIMFMGLKAPFQPGMTVPVTLVFQKAGEISVSLPVLQRAPAPE